MQAVKIKPAEAAAIMGCSPQFVRIGLQQGKLDIGDAIKMSSIWTYNISAAALARRQGVTVEELEKKIRELRNGMQTRNLREFRANDTGTAKQGQRNSITAVSAIRGNSRRQQG